MATSNDNKQPYEKNEFSTGLPDQGEAPASLLPTVLHRLGLDRQQGQRPLEALLAALSHPEWYVRAEALRELGAVSQQGGSVPLDHILLAMRDTHATVRIAAIRVLGLQSSYVPTNELLHALQDSQWPVREAAALALRQLGAYVQPALLLAAMHDQDASVRDAAAFALQQRQLIALTSSPSPTLTVLPAPEARPVEQAQQEPISRPFRFRRVTLTPFPARKSVRYNRNTGASMHETEYRDTEYRQTMRSRGQRPRPRRWSGVRRVLTAGVIAAVIVVCVVGWAFVVQHFRPASSVTLTGGNGQSATPTPTPTQGPSRGPVGKTLYTATCDVDAFYAIAWSKDSSRIATGCRTLQAWDAKTGKHPVNYGGEATSSILSVSWSPDGSSIQESAQVVQVYDSATGHLKATYQPSLVTGNAASYSGPALASDVNLSGGNMIYDSAWSPDGKMIASAVDGNGYGFNVQVWNAQTGAHLFTLQDNSNATTNAYISQVDWSPDGKYLAFTENGVVQVWSVATKQRVVQHNGGAFAWSPDGVLIASISADGTIEIWNVATNKTVFVYRGQAGEQGGGAIAWSPDGTRIASAGNDIQVWDAMTGGHIYVYKGHGQALHTYINNIKWSPDSTMIASGNQGGEAGPYLGILKVWVAA